MLEVLALNKTYGNYQALSELSFAVQRGEVVGFLGPNGAGKTTTLRIIAGFLLPSSGRVTLDGISVHLEPVRARRLLGYMPEDCPYYPELRVREYLEFRARLKGVSGKDCRRAVDRAASLVRIDDRQESLIGNLSKGYRQRLGLADALIAKPPLLILDEPTSGLDPNQIRDVRKVLKDLSEEHTVLLSTHILAEVEQTCQRALVIHQGRLVAENTIAGLKDARRVLEAELEVKLPSAELSAQLMAQVISREALLPESQPAPEGSASETAPGGEVWERWVVRLEAADLARVENWVAALCQAGVQVRRAEQRRASLEQVFAQLTSEVAS